MTVIEKNIDEWNEELGLKKRYIEQGIEKGIEKGLHQKAIETAKKMKEKGIDINLISEVTGLPKEEIEEL